jgi:hypothetical protein
MLFFAASLHRRKAAHRLAHTLIDFGAQRQPVGRRLCAQR